MASVSVLESFRQFLTENLDGNWVRDAWNSEQLGRQQLPDDYDDLHEATDWLSVIQDTCNSVREYVLLASAARTAAATDNHNNGQEMAGNVADEVGDAPVGQDLAGEEERQFWSDLIGSGVSYKAVILVLAAFVERGTQKSANLGQKELAIRAAGLYLHMVCLPGGNAFDVFNGTLYQSSIDVIRMIRQGQNDSGGVQHQSGKSGRNRRNSAADGTAHSPSRRATANSPPRKGMKRKPPTAGGPGAAKRKKQTLSQLQRELLEDSSEEEEAGAPATDGEAGPVEQRDDGDDDDEEMVVLSAKEMALLVDRLQEFLSDVTFVFEHYALESACDLSLDHTVERLCELLVPPWEQGRLAAGAKEVLSVLCRCRRQGTADRLITLIMKHCLPAILSYASRTLVVFVCRLAMRESAPDGVFLLVQHVCARVPDRADARSKMATVVLTLLESMPAAARVLTTAWLTRYGSSSRVNNRLFCLDVFGLLLGRPPPDTDGVSDELLVYSGSGCLLRAVLGRCSDRASTVRAKALSVVAASLQSVVSATSQEPGLHSAVLYMFTPSTSSVESARAARERMLRLMEMTPPVVGGGARPAGLPLVDGASAGEKVSAQRSTTRTDESEGESETTSTVGNVEASESVHTPVNVAPVDSSAAHCDLPDYDSTMELVQRRAKDSKVHVRKTASLVLQCAMELNGAHDAANVALLEGHCGDPSLLVRKQALQGLTAVLMAHPTNDMLRLAWMRGVLPTIMDVESTCQDKCADMIEEVILNNLALHTQSTSRNPHYAMVWKMLNYCFSEEGFDTWRFLLRGVIFMSRANKIGANLVPILLSHVETENDGAAWLLLSGLSCCSRIKKPQFVLRYWDAHRDAILARADTFEFVLRVLGNLAKNFAPDDLHKYTGELRDLLLDFACPPHLIPFLVEALCSLCNAAEEKEKENAAKRSKLAMCEAVIKKCDSYLSSVFLNKRGGNKDANEDLVIRHLFTVAEIALIHPKSVTSKLFLVMKSIIATPAGDPDHQLPNQGSNTFFTKRLRNHALIAIGKLCLQYDAFAKQCLPAFGRELESSDDFVAKTNIVTIMCDMCKRYTTLVDPYFPSIVACLRDESVMLRATTLTLLTNLLQEDYLKWRGSLFYAFLESLIDNTSELRRQTECSLLYVLAVRHPAMFFQHFMECLFYFNAYEDHESYNKISSSGGDVSGVAVAVDEQRCCQLSGEAGREKRMFLYRFMLEHMSDDHRFQLTVKLCQDVLGGVVEEGIRLVDARGRPCPAACSLVGDTLAVLSCEQIKLSSLRGAGAGGGAADEPADEGELAAAVMATAKKTILTQIVKKNFTERVLPVIISLKHKLERALSPLVHDLMLYLREMVKDYKNEVRDVLAADKQLATEVEYDLKRFEKEQLQLQNKRNSVAPVAPTPTVEKPAVATGPVLPADGFTSLRRSVHGTNTETTPLDDHLAAVNAGCTNVSVVLTHLERDTGLARRSSKRNGAGETTEVANAGCTEVSVVLTPLISATLTERARQSSKRNGAGETAEKRIHRLKKVVPNVECDHDEAVVKTEPMDVAMSSPRSDGMSAEAATPVPIARNRRDFLRAISTPHSAVDDITFREEVGGGRLNGVGGMVAEVVMSPIPRCAQAIVSRTVQRVGDDAAQQIILHVPDPVTTKVVLRQWAVRPTRKRRSLSVSGEPEAEVSPS